MAVDATCINCNALRFIACLMKVAKAAALDMSEPAMDRFLDRSSATVMRLATSERDLPGPVARVYRAAVASVWPDVRQELKDSLQGIVLKRALDDEDDACAMNSSNGGSTSNKGGSTSNYAIGASGLAPCWHPKRWRAFVLHHYLPHDKGFWTKLRRDPVWFGFMLLTLVPVYGVRVAFHAILLLLMTCGGRGQLDQYQLAKFVLSFKGTQFLSGGFLLALQGGVSYWRLVALPEPSLANLAAHAPGVSEGVSLEAVDLFGAVALSWIAMALLPYASQRGAPRTVAETAKQQRAKQQQQQQQPTGSDSGSAAGSRFRSSSSSSSSKGAGGEGTSGGDLNGGSGDVKSRYANQSAAGAANPPSVQLRRGGRFTRLLRWDVACFTGAVLLFVGIVLGYDLAWTSWQAAAALYWCRVLYALTNLPFAVFLLPGFSQVLLHAKPTGYNRYGRCVPLRLPPLPPQPLPPPDENPRTSPAAAASVASNPQDEPSTVPRGLAVVGPESSPEPTSPTPGAVKATSASFDGGGAPAEALGDDEESVMAWRHDCFAHRRSACSPPSPSSSAAYGLSSGATTCTSVTTKRATALPPLSLSSVFGAVLGRGVNNGSRDGWLTRRNSAAEVNEIDLVELGGDGFGQSLLA